MQNENIKPRIDDLVMLIQSVLQARTRVMMDLNVSQENLTAVVECLPSMRTPTIAPLRDSEWVAVRAAIPKNKLAEIIPKLKTAGACDIVTTPCQQLIP